MEDIKPINEKTDGDCGYVAGYNNRKIALYAKSLSAAKDLASEGPQEGVGPRMGQSR